MNLDLGGLGIGLAVGIAVLSIARCEQRSVGEFQKTKRLEMLVEKGASEITIDETKGVITWTK